MEDPQEVVLILFGMCIWDYLTSLWFEYRLLTQEIRFRWQFVPYFLARYFVLAYIIINVVCVFIDFPTLSACVRASFMNSGFYIGVLSLVFSTWNLLTRTIIIWGHHPLVMKSLLVVGLLHFVLSLVVASVGRHPCDPSTPSMLSITIFGTITAAIELVILLLSLAGIRRASQHRESPLARILVTQGIAYFVMVLSLHASTIIVNSIPTDRSTGLWVGVLGTTLAAFVSTCYFDIISELQRIAIRRRECIESNVSNSPGIRVRTSPGEYQRA